MSGKFVKVRVGLAIAGSALGMAAGLALAASPASAATPAHAVTSQVQGHYGQDHDGGKWCHDHDHDGDRGWGNNNDNTNTNINVNHNFNGLLGIDL